MSIGGNLPDVVPNVDEMDRLPPVLTASGIQRMFKKSKNTVLMAIYRGNLGAYRDGRNLMVYTVGAVAMWGIPEGKVQR